MSLIKVVPYALGMTLGILDTPEPRMYPRSGYFLVSLYVRETVFNIRSYNNKLVAKMIFYDSTRQPEMAIFMRLAFNIRSVHDY